ncbi:unnamed protein product [Protopolystoma xenopodis]|uniref:PIN domain-containing protein n=1 Tax=Protopolystoma xenopodis TaxID=117903 RepID=A0A448XC60_9PLAT|nr:unnamed protein product [Protopolystoma xenopodis]
MNWTLGALLVRHHLRLIREVVLITSDRNLRVKAISQNIPARPLRSLVTWSRLPVPQTIQLPRPPQLPEAGASGPCGGFPCGHGNPSRKQTRIKPTAAFYGSRKTEPFVVEQSISSEVVTPLCDATNTSTGPHIVKPQSVIPS